MRFSESQELCVCFFEVGFSSKAVSSLRRNDNDFALRKAINGSLEMALVDGTALCFHYFRHVCSMFRQNQKSEKPGALALMFSAVVRISFSHFVRLTSNHACFSSERKGGKLTSFL
jgi:hypothetical protein